jgi:outer membrane protein assembly factor BamB
MARVVAVVALLGAALAVTAGDWPTYLHDPERTATSWDEALLSPANARHLTKLWAFQTGGVIAASPIVAAGTVYVGSWDGYEYALNAATGALTWKTYLGKTTPSPTYCHAGPVGITSSAAVQGGVVYVGGGDSYWYALDAATGAILWRVFTGDSNFNSGHYNWSSPLLYNGFAYIGVASFGDCPLVQGQLLQVDLATHQIVHTFDAVPSGQVGGGIWTSPSIDPATGTIYVTTGTPRTVRTQPLADAIIALDAATLALKGSWQGPVEQMGLDLDQDWGSTPLVYNSPTGTPLVAAVNKDGFVYAFNRANVGAGPVWRQRIAIGGWCPQCGDGSVSSGTYSQGLLFQAGGAAIIITRQHGMLFADSFAAGRLGAPPRSPWRARGSAWRIRWHGIRVVRPVLRDPHVEKELSINRPRWTNYSVSVDVKAPATPYTFGITGRRRDAQNCYQFVLTRHRWEFGRRVRGHFHTLAAGAFTYHAGGWYRFSLTFSGRRIWAAINGVTLAALEDGTFGSGGISLRTTTTPEYGRVRVALVSRGSVRALNPSTGDFVWQAATPDSVIPALAYANGLVVDGAGATLEVRRAASGARLYSYTTRGPIYGAPSVANGRIYAGSADGKVYAFGVARHR